MTKEELQLAMDQYKLTAQDIAKACYVSVDTVYKWLRGDRNISRMASGHLANYLGNKRR